MTQLAESLFDFIERCPTACHTVQTVRELLTAAGFEELRETEMWTLKAGGKYFTTRSMTSLIAFSVPKRDFNAFSIIAPHGDSPCFQVKGEPNMNVEKHYVKLNTQVYGGMVTAHWLDRPLSVAGRLTVKTESGIKTVLTNIDRDLLVIPSLAPHMDREQGTKKLDAQRETLPLMGGSEGDVLALAAEAAGVEKDDVLSYDLYLYNRARGTVYGAKNEFLAAPKLDDLECVYAAVSALLHSENHENCTVCAVFDNEETGSMSRQGADSTFLSDVIARICESAGKSEAQRQQAIQGGLLLSADNAHAVHPNYPEKADPTSRCYLNGGIVVKHGAGYATDGVTAGVFRYLCENAGVSVQEFYNHSSIPGGGTLGKISGSHVSIPTVDIGLPQLAMHSPYETAGVKDLQAMIDAMTAFYNATPRWTSDGACEL